MATETIAITSVSEVISVVDNTDAIAVSQAEETVQADLTEQVVHVALTEEVLQLPSEVAAVASVQQPGRRAFVDLVAGQNVPVVIDCNQALTWRIDAAALTLATPMQIDIINIPPGIMALICILVANVPPGGCAVLWPAAAGISNTPVGPGLSNEYEVRTWDGGATMHIKRSAWYQVV